MSSDFGSCNASALGYYVESTLHYRDAGSGTPTLEGTLCGTGCTMGSISATTFTTVGFSPSAKFSSSGGSFVVISNGYGRANGIGGSCAVQTLSSPTGTGTNAIVRRILIQMVVPVGAPVGAPLYFTCGDFASVTSGTVDFRVSQPEQSAGTTTNTDSTCWDSCVAGGVTGTIPTGTATVNNANYDTGILVPAVGQTVSVGFSLTGDVGTILVFTGTNYIVQNALSNIKFFAVT